VVSSPMIAGFSRFQARFIGRISDKKKASVSSDQIISYFEETPKA
jgi:hypothetical protein